MPVTDTNIDRAGKRQVPTPPLSQNDLPSIGGQMKVGELPGQSVILDVRSLGRDVWKTFKDNPDLSGIIFVNDETYAGMVSNTQFLKIMSRPFGREIFEGRQISLLLKELGYEPLMLEYDLGIQNAITACLEREDRLIYEPFLAVNRERGLLKVCSVQVLMHASAKAANLRNHQMEQILGSVTDGLMLIDRDFRIGSEHSKALEHMLGRNDVSGKLFTEVISPLLAPHLHTQIAEYLQVLFDRKLIDRLIKSINPIQQIKVVVSDGGDPRQNSTKHLTFGFERIRSQGEIKQILVRIEDITRSINLAQELEQRGAAAENRMKLMLQLVSTEPRSLRGFLDLCRKETAAISRTIQDHDGKGPVIPLLEGIFRTVHRLKGDAALLHLDIHKNLLHSFEDELSRLKAAGPDAPLNTLAPPLNAFVQSLDDAESVLEQFTKWSIEPSAAPGPDNTEGEVSALISKMESLAAEIGSRLGKKASLHPIIPDAALPAPCLSFLKDVLVQFIRNSLTHGIEDPSTRESWGKPAAGTLQIVVEKNAENFEVIFQDDGAGLDWDRIRGRAQALNLPSESEDDLKDALFAPGFSTAAAVTEDSGRGVGLDLIRARVLELGGHIAVHSEPGNYCAFQILLPAQTGGTP